MRKYIYILYAYYTNMYVKCKCHDLINISNLTGPSIIPGAIWFVYHVLLRCLINPPNHHHVMMD